MEQASCLAKNLQLSQQGDRHYNYLLNKNLQNLTLRIKIAIASTKNFRVIIISRGLVTKPLFFGFFLTFNFFPMSRAENLTN